MGKMNFAAVDIGSNAVRLLIKSVDAEGVFSKELMLRVPLRLGDEVFAAGEIPREKVRRLVRLMKAYRQLMKVYDVADCRCCATSAMRDAVNGREVAGEVSRKTGMEIEIIDGAEEARILYGNRLAQAGGGNYLYVDVGGGSVELDLLSGGRPVFSRSYDAGTIRALHGKVAPGERERMRRDLEMLGGEYAPAAIVGSGGNINKLSRMAGERPLLPVATLRGQYEALSALTKEERMERYGLKADRADVIVPAAAVFLEAADAMRADGILVPMTGLADGMIDGLYARQQGKI